MADKAIIMKDWIDKIVDDPYVETTPLELGCILYATCQYWWNEEMTNIGDVFGKEYASLNRSMANIYSQIDKMRNYRAEDAKAHTKYDSDQIKELRLQGHTAKEICQLLGYPESRARSLTSNKGWIEAGKELAQKSQIVQKSVQNCTESTDTDIQTDCTEICTDLYTENTDSVQKSQNYAERFNF